MHRLAAGAFVQDVARMRSDAGMRSHAGFMLMRMQAPCTALHSPRALSQVLQKWLRLRFLKASAE
jgi:hypothetical protein